MGCASSPFFKTTLRRLRGGGRYSKLVAVVAPFAAAGNGRRYKALSKTHSRRCAKIDLVDFAKLLCYFNCVLILQR